MEEVKKKRGRPRKVITELPQEIKSLVEEVQEKQQQLQKDEPQLKTTETIIKKDSSIDWDVKIGDQIDYFDKRLSYELTGYRPITETEGLDFNPNWFTQARQQKINTDHYCSYYFGSKAYRDFWNLEYKRCRDGMTVNEYTIPGTYYYFLNYYQLPQTEVKKLGTSRQDIFPEFYTSQYEFFHYLELCKVLKKDVGLMKSRGVGFSEINAAICDQIYNCYPNSVCMISAYAQNYLDKSLDKIWGGLNFANDKTDGGFFKLRQALNKQMVKKASFYKKVNGQDVETGWMSMIEAVVADKDSKIRGDRVDLLIFEEAGSNPVLRKSYIKGNALVEIGGNRFGMRMVGGTGGDSGPSLEGLSDIYYNPEAYNILPFYHNYTETGDWVKTAFFIPSYIAFYREGYVDNRGVCNIKKAKEYYENERNKLISSPKALIDYKAEYCFTAEEAFALEGQNKFNKVKLTEQQVAIKVKQEVPNIKRGYMEFLYSGTERKRKDIIGVRFKPHIDGPVHILEEPVWEDDPKNKINNLYVAGIDGIDIGMSETSAETKSPSKFCTVIKRRIYGTKEPTYIAYYLDRPNDIREAYKQTIALLMWYNCQANIEATRLSLITYARDNQFMQYFMKRPRICYGDNIKQRSNNQYGTTATKAMIDHQTDLIADYVEDYGSNIWFTEFLEQLISYSDENKGKFDIVAAMGMAEVGDEELSGVVPKPINSIQKTFQNIGYYKDEKGYTHFGVIPSTQQFQTKATWDLYDGRNITSNPRYR